MKTLIVFLTLFVVVACNQPSATTQKADQDTIKSGVSTQIPVAKGNSDNSNASPNSNANENANSNANNNGNKKEDDPVVPPTVATETVAATFAAAIVVVDAPVTEPKDTVNLPNPKSEDHPCKNPHFKHNTDVYVAGIYYETPYKHTAAYWKNGTLNILEDGIEALDIKVVEGVVFVVGTSIYGATLWINGIPTLIAENANAKAIYIDGEDVYVVGDYFGLGYPKAFIWKNNEASLLDESYPVESRANGIFVHNGDVYVTGYRFQVDDWIHNAVYWKNGKITTLSPTMWGVGTGITVSDTSIYVSGYYLKNGSKWTASVWQDSIKTDLTDGSEHSSANGIYLDNGELFMSGYFFRGRGDVAHLWNTTKTQDLDPLQSGRAEKIFVSNGKTYTAGYYNNGKDMVAAYWKDGIRTTLSDKRSEAYGITTDLAFVCE